jgi:hypothetical protein
MAILAEVRALGLRLSLPKSARTSRAGPHDHVYKSHHTPFPGARTTIPAAGRALHWRLSLPNSARTPRGRTLTFEAPTLTPGARKAIPAAVRALRLLRWRLSLPNPARTSRAGPHVHVCKPTHNTHIP